MPPEYLPRKAKLWVRKLAIASPAFLHPIIVWAQQRFVDRYAVCPPYAFESYFKKTAGLFPEVVLKNYMRFGAAFILPFLPSYVQAVLRRRWKSLATLDLRKGVHQHFGHRKSVVERLRVFKRSRYFEQHPYHEELYDALPKTKPGQRSVVFLHYSYYHHYYLAAALRKRGWNALSVASEPPDSPSRQYYHGEDVNIWSGELMESRRNSISLLKYIEDNIKMLFWHNENLTSLFEECYQTSARDAVPWDFIYLRSKGIKLGVSMSGCLTGTGQTEFNEYTNGVCNACAWQNNPVVCSDPKNLAIGEMYGALADLYAIEGDWVVNASRKTKRAFREPLTFCLDHELWHPDLEVPQHMRFEKKEGEILIFHSVGNYKTRNVNDRNIKGTPAVLQAIDRLKSEGYPVKLVFVHDVHSADMKYYQVQADIVVDQIVYGRYGASSRECMMLGKPTITRLVREQPSSVGRSESLDECPLIDASPTTVYDRLKYLIENPEARKQIGEASRAYAVKWHSAEACAARFEKVYDRLMAGKFPLDHPSAYHEEGVLH